MRIFAFVLWHHFAFLVISIAILGFGAGGAVLASVRRLREADFRSSVAIACLAFTVSTFIGPMSLSAIDIFGKMGARELVAVAGQYLVFALPYFFAGYVISIVLMHEARAVDRFYFVNMLGSGVGCFVLFATLEPLGAEGSLCVIAVLGALGAVLVAGPRLRIFAVVATLGCLGLLTAGDSLLEFRVAESKLLATAERLDRKHLAGTWTPLARLDVYEEPTVGGAVLFQDGDAPAFMPGTQHRYPDSEIHSVSYVVSERPNVLIIGVGGGLDVKWALEKQARSIVGVEINARTLDYYTDDFKSITGYRKSQPDLELHVAEGRHFVGSSERSFDLIQMSGVDTYTALSSGAYVLSESYLYTEEAFHDYLAHLTPDGLFSFIRFAFPVPRETLRVMVIACKVLADRGVPEPWRHVVVIKQPTEGESTSLGAILVKKSPFSEDELARLVAWTDAHHYTREYLPGESGKQSPFHDFAEKLADGQAEEFLDSYPYEVRPVQDDRPFFFSQHRLSTVWTWLRDLLSGSATRELPENVPWVALLRDFQTKPHAPRRDAGPAGGPGLAVHLRSAAQAQGAAQRVRGRAARLLPLPGPRLHPADDLGDAALQPHPRAPELRHLGDDGHLPDRLCRRQPGLGPLPPPERDPAAGGRRGAPGPLLAPPAALLARGRELPPQAELRRVHAGDDRAPRADGLPDGDVLPDRHPDARRHAQGVDPLGLRRQWGRERPGLGARGLLRDAARLHERAVDRGLPLLPRGMADAPDGAGVAIGSG
ncbi:MAG: hypothetical protein ACE5F1_02380 [Planctomycetota bacterium]